MGISASRRVHGDLHRSPQFNSACNSVYADCRSRSQHAFAGVKPYQLYSAAEQLHGILSRSLLLISKWVPDPPDRDRVDRAFKTVIRSHRSGSTRDGEEETVLDEAEFMDFAEEVFARAVLASVEREILKRVSVGVVGIGGVGMVVKPRKGVLVAAIGAYALGVAADIYLKFDS